MTAGHMETNDARFVELGAGAGVFPLVPDSECVLLGATLDNFGGGGGTLFVAAVSVFFTLGVEATGIVVTGADVTGAAEMGVAATPRSS